MLNLQPETRKIVLVAGSSALDKRFEGRIRAELKAWKGGVEIESISDLPMDEILKKVASLAGENSNSLCNGLR